MGYMLTGAACIGFSVLTLPRWRSATLGQQIALFAIGLLGTALYAVGALQT